MQQTSPFWKDEHTKILVGESFVEIYYEMADPDSLRDAVASDNGAIHIANTSQIVSEVEKNIVPYATLERNLVVLNGSLQEIPVSSFGDTGFISQSFSNEGGLFTAIPIIEIAFSVIHTPVISGITIIWADAYDEYAESFIVSAYNDNTLVAEKRVDSNRLVTSVVKVDIENYNLIRIEVLKWCLPLRRARIAHILVGVTKVYDKTDIMSFEHTQEISPLSSILPKSAVKFEIDNTSNIYNPLNPNSESKYIMGRQEIRTRYGYKINDAIEWIDGGVFYMSEWDAPQNGLTASFEARDLLELMHDTYKKGLYHPNGALLYDLALDVLREANLPLNYDGSVKWFIDESLTYLRTDAPLPLMSLGDCLMRIANAAACTLLIDRNGKIHIKRIDMTSTNYPINNFNSFRRSDLSLTKAIRQINVNAYSYRVDNEIKTLYEGILNIVGTQSIWVDYEGPASNATASLIGDGIIVSAKYYTNACQLTIAANGHVLITVRGNTLNTTKTIFSIETENKNGEIFTIDNLLITDGIRAQEIGEWAKNYLSNRRIISSEWRADPAVDVLDIVNIENNYGVALTRLNSITLTYTGAFRGRSEGRILDIVDAPEPPIGGVS